VIAIDIIFIDRKLSSGEHFAFFLHFDFYIYFFFVKCILCIYIYCVYGWLWHWLFFVNYSFFLVLHFVIN